MRREQRMIRELSGKPVVAGDDLRVEADRKRQVRWVVDGDSAAGIGGWLSQLPSMHTYQH